LTKKFVTINCRVLYDDIVDFHKIKLLNPKARKSVIINESILEYLQNNSNLLDIKTNRDELKLHRKFYIHKPQLEVLHSVIKVTDHSIALLIRESFRYGVDKLRKEFPNYKYLKYEVMI